MWKGEFAPHLNLAGEPDEWARLNRPGKRIRPPAFPCKSGKIRNVHILRRIGPFKDLP